MSTAGYYCVRCLISMNLMCRASVKLLAYWYRHQLLCIRRQKVHSGHFCCVTVFNKVAYCHHFWFASTLYTWLGLLFIQALYAVYLGTILTFWHMQMTLSCWCRVASILGARGAIAPPPPIKIKIYLGESIFSPPQSFWWTAKIAPRMHHKSPFWDPKSKKFLGRGCAAILPYGE